jgi:hypothetical protein
MHTYNSTIAGFLAAKKTYRREEVTIDVGIPFELEPGYRICRMDGICIFNHRPWVNPYEKKAPKRKIIDEDDPNDDSDNSNNQPGAGNDREIQSAIHAAMFKQDQQCRRVNALLYADPTVKDQLWLFFHKGGMRSCTRAKFFEKSHFKSPSPCVLPDSIKSLYGLNAGTYILPGRFAIQRIDQGYAIAIKLGIR